MLLTSFIEQNIKFIELMAMSIMLLLCLSQDKTDDIFITNLREFVLAVLNYVV